MFSSYTINSVLISDSNNEKYEQELVKRGGTPETKRGE